MTVHTGPQFDNSAAAAAEAKSTTGAPSFQERQTASMSFLDGFTGVIPGSLPAEQLRKLRENVEGIFGQRDVSKNFSLQLIDLDKEQDRVFYSALVVAVQDKARTDKVAMYIIAIESSAKLPSPTVTTRSWGNANNGTGQNRNIELLHTPHNIVDKVFRDRAQARVQNSFGGATILLAGAAILPSEFNVEDKSALAQFISAVTDACWSVLWVDKHGTDLNLTAINNDSFISVEPVVGRNTRYTAEGFPVRSDFLIRVDAVPTSKSESKSWSDAGNKERELGAISGFFDAMWWPVNAAGNNQWGGMTIGQQQNVMTQPYLPRMVITGLENKFMPTLAVQLFLLSMCSALSDKNKEYFKYFYQSIDQRRRSPDKSKLDWTDIGALAIEAESTANPNFRPANATSQWGQRAPTQDASFGVEAFDRLMSDVLFRPGMIYSIDVPWMGTAADGLDQLRKSALNIGDANRKVVAALDVLTDGNATRMLVAEKVPSLFMDDETVVHLGQYVDSNGQLADIRNVDHVAVVNYFGERDPSVIKLWWDSFYNNTIPQEVKLDTRKRIIEEMCGKDVKFTGFANRVTWNSSAFRAVAQAINATNFRPTLRTNGLQLTAGHLTPQLEAGIVNGAGGGGMQFNHGFVGGNTGGNNNGAAFGADFFGR